MRSILPRLGSLSAACVFALSLTACDDNDGDDEASGDASTAHDGQTPADQDAAADPSDVLLAPPEEGRGIQLTMQTTIEAGTEVEHCQFVSSGDEPLIVNHDEVRFTAGSHHVLLYTTPYDEVPTENEFGDEVDTSGVFDCSDGVQGFWRAQGLIAASQSADGESAISFPEGVGVRVPANTLLILNAHYINPTTSDLEPEVFINLHTIPEDELEQEGGLLFWYNPFLKVPAAGESVMRAGCTVKDDISITNAQSHMHKRGVGYVAEMISPEGDREVIYETNTWEDVPVAHYTPNLEVPAGSRIEWECEYQNPDDRDVFQGATTEDEMCMFIGSYYPRDDSIGFCMRNSQPFMGAQWMLGRGESSCDDSLSCILQGVSDEEEGDPTSRLTECLIDSAPDVSEPLSEVLGCLGTAEEGEELASCESEVDTCQAL